MRFFHFACIPVLASAMISANASAQSAKITSETILFRAKLSDDMSITVTSGAIDNALYSSLMRNTKLIIPDHPVSYRVAFRLEIAGNEAIEVWSHIHVEDGEHQYSGYDVLDLRLEGSTLIVAQAENSVVSLYLIDLLHSSVTGPLVLRGWSVSPVWNGFTEKTSNSP